MSFASIIMGEFPSGQRGQTVNLLAMLSVVRIHLPPFLFFNKLSSRGRAVRKLVGLITRRSQVQILPPLLLFAQVAQLVEQRTENPRVTGSIPVLGTFYAFRKPLCTKGLRFSFTLEQMASNSLSPKRLTNV